jgi:hypothetical protein
MDGLADLLIELPSLYVLVCVLKNTKPSVYKQIPFLIW